MLTHNSMLRPRVSLGVILYPSPFFVFHLFFLFFSLFLFFFFSFFSFFLSALKHTSAFFVSRFRKPLLERWRRRWRASLLSQQRVDASQIRGNRPWALSRAKKFRDHWAAECAPGGMRALRSADATNCISHRGSQYLASRCPRERHHPYASARARSLAGPVATKDHCADPYRNRSAASFVSNIVR